MLQIIKLVSLILVMPFFNQIDNRTQSNHINHEIKEEKGNDFAEFLSYFPKKDLPYEVNLEMIADIAESHARQQSKAKNFAKLNLFKRKKLHDERLKSKFIPFYKLSMFSRRSGPPAIEPIARIYLDDNHIAVLYNSKAAFGLSSLVTINMITYDLNGNVVLDEDSQIRPLEIAKSNPQHVQTCRLLDNGKLELVVFKNIWEKDIDEYGIHGNRILNREILEKKNINVLAGNGVLALSE